MHSWLAFISICLISTLSLALNLAGKQVVSLKQSISIDLGDQLKALSGDTLLILGTYAADFNAIEYAQRVKYYLPLLEQKGIANFYFVLSTNVCLIFHISK